VRPVWRVVSMSVLRQSCCLWSASVGETQILMPVLYGGICMFLLVFNSVDVETTVSMPCTLRPGRSCSFCVWGRWVHQYLLLQLHFCYLNFVCLLSRETEHFFFQIFNGVFLKVNKATINMLRRVEPYVAYGYIFFADLLLSCCLFWYIFQWVFTKE
jgi:hypothetical protein